MRELLLVLLMLPFLTVGAHAQDVEDRLADVSGALEAVEALPQDVRDISGQLRFDGSYDTQSAVERLVRRLYERAREQLASVISSGVQMFSVALLCALSECFCSSAAMRETIDRIGCCTVAVYISGSLTELMTSAADTVCDLSSFSHAVLPALFMSAAAGGGAMSASARFAAASLSMDVLITVSQNTILPLIYMYFALSVSLSLYENSILQAAVKTCKWLVVSSMTVLTLSFGAYLSLSGLIAGSTDALTVKTARTVISRSLPVVGGLLADSASILLAAASVVKNSLGVFAMISVCALCVGPVVAFSLRLLVFKTAAASVAFLPGARLSKLIDAVASVYGMLLGLIGCCAAMLFMSIVSGIKVLGAV